jgi:hypothetical protein
MNTHWHDAVRNAIERIVNRHHSIIVTRVQLIEEELQQIERDTATLGQTPQQTLSRVLQDLRDEGYLEFLSKGRYKVCPPFIDIEKGDLADSQIDKAIHSGRLRIGFVDTESVEAQARIRRGQSRLRELTLENYSAQCALCDVQDRNLLVTSHIAGWAEVPEARGLLCNAICLCRFHDALFETGYWSLSDSLKVVIKFRSKSQMITNLLSPSVQFRIPITESPSVYYLAYHRAHHDF